MPVLVACFKWVVDEAYIRRTSAGELDLSSVSYKISDYDRNALEEAARMKEASGGSVLAVTVGVPESTKGVKDALSRGADQAFFIADPSFGMLGASETAAILAEVIRTRIGNFDLVLCGEGSSDLYNQQVGIRLAERLGIPCLSFVQKLELEEGRVVAERRLEDGIERVSAPLPAVVTVLPDINIPRIPGVKDTLSASRKPVVTIGKDDLAVAPDAHFRTISLAASRLDRQCERFGADETDIRRFIGALRQKGVLR
ncbi:MAG: electron transfer flavoprotein subunit beta [Deltaproteobacteria bacterium HGW-Deltaproteobacteria-19]|jgi:electron transfer flavoprotein beta subunit|nr:MAG: electron transfer flavoprotein subunit beta [Deltaproteobacteria bacterium HGW-Deltaproteobacteria-19]